MTNGVVELVFLWIGKGFFQTWQVACRQEVYNTKIPSEIEVAPCYTLLTLLTLFKYCQGGITCGAIDEPWKSSKAIDGRVIINFRNKNVVIAHFRDKNVVIFFYR